ncbi:hypothetical protein Lfu02_15420 [Longispora fulva]|uniref:GT2 family glycosyltransferase n=1 Tax=Longispora fulva TaxID=619741 RepID=A0A8J7GGU7_9ACTN|nr:glycosyltransferase family 2 protein [Longispora fulva]MBG6140448.1 GT2 family glycosyltransferase [Longispora fulva]GIG57170.1 hypothetical protein Lfu02_15420 [Longispora fulva]
MTSLADVLAGRDNDHRPHTTAFTARTRLGWHTPTPPEAGEGTGVSVVIPAHNNDYSLPAVLDALDARRHLQTRVEVIVVDDASTDDTGRIAAKHRAVDRVMRFPQKRGPAAARNLGTFLATWPTVIYLDADMVIAPHVLTDMAVRAHPELVLVGFRQNVPYSRGRDDTPIVPGLEPDLAADHRVLWKPPVGKPMFYSGQVYTAPLVGHPLDDTDDFRDLGNGRAYFDWDLPRMLVTALVAVPRAKVADVGGFDPGFGPDGWGSEDTHLGAALAAAGCKIVPLRQARGWHIDPPDADAAWQAKFATAAARIAHYRHLLTLPAPTGKAGEFAATGARLLTETEDLR